MSGLSPPFLLAAASSPSLLPVVFFYRKFYDTLFNLAPEAQSLFVHGLEAQGRMLASVIKFIVKPDAATTTSGGPVDVASQERVFVASLQQLARVHNRIGVSADSYGLMGIVLLHSIRACVGEAYWTEELRLAWVHVFSKVMAIMLPVVIANEMPHHHYTTQPPVCPASGASAAAGEECPSARLSVSRSGSISSGSRGARGDSNSDVAMTTRAPAVKPLTPSSHRSSDSDLFPASSAAALGEIWDYHSAAATMQRDAAVFRATKTPSSRSTTPRDDRTGRGTEVEGR